MHTAKTPQKTQCFQAPPAVFPALTSPIRPVIYLESSRTGLVSRRRRKRCFSPPSRPRRLSPEQQPPDRQALMVLQRPPRAAPEWRLLSRHEGPAHTGFSGPRASAWVPWVSTSASRSGTSPWATAHRCPGSSGWPSALSAWASPAERSPMNEPPAVLGTLLIAQWAILLPSPYG